MSFGRVSQGPCQRALLHSRFSANTFSRNLSTNRPDVDWRNTRTFQVLTRRPEVMKAFEDVVVAFDKAGKVC